MVRNVGCTPQEKRKIIELLKRIDQYADCLKKM